MFDIGEEGAGFDHGATTDLGDANRIAAVSGRGLTLMHSFMDEVEYNVKGNRVRMIKRTSDRSV